MSCHNTKVIDAPLDKVWAAIRDFHDMAWAKGVIEKLDVIGDKKGDQLGARRKLNDAFVETLRGLDDVDHVIKYSIDEGPGPLASCTGYIGQVRAVAHSDGNKTFVEWTSTWNTSDGGVKELCDPVYQAALNAMAANLK